MSRGSLAWRCYFQAGRSLMGQGQSFLSNYFVKDSCQAKLSTSERSSYIQVAALPEGCHCALIRQDSHELPITPFRGLPPHLFPEQPGSTTRALIPLLWDFCRAQTWNFSFLPSLSISWIFVCVSVCFHLPRIKSCCRRNTCFCNSCSAQSGELKEVPEQ